jgi:hypothetical protein
MGPSAFSTSSMPGGDFAFSGMLRLIRYSVFTPIFW